MDAKAHLHDGGSRLNSISGPITSSSGVINNSGGPTILGKANKIDPYYLITQVFASLLTLLIYRSIDLDTLMSEFVRPFASRSAFTHSKIKSLFVRGHRLAVGYPTIAPSFCTSTACTGAG
jgi:hypothetical protein